MQYVILHILNEVILAAFHLVSLWEAGISELRSKIYLYLKYDFSNSLAGELNKPLSAPQAQCSWRADVARSLFGSGWFQLHQGHVLVGGSGEYYSPGICKKRFWWSPRMSLEGHRYSTWQVVWRRCWEGHPSWAWACRDSNQRLLGECRDWPQKCPSAWKFRLFLTDHDD